MTGAWIPGGAWVTAATTHVPAMWGDGDQVLWSMGEPLLIAGPPGVGKTTILQQLAITICGARDQLELLGLGVSPVEPGKKVAYLACDRPRQAQRSLRRMVKDRSDVEILDDRLMVWEGPLPFSVADSPAKLAAWLRFRGVGVVLIDSVKDLVGDTSEGKTGAAWNTVVQHVIAEGIEVAALHHPRKATLDGRRPRKLDDLHGSTWIVAGAGSVVYLFGEAGDLAVELLHLKQPAADVGPLKVIHDHVNGRSRLANRVTVADVFASGSTEGVTPKEAARQLYDSPEPRQNLVEKARRLLESEVKENRATVTRGQPNAPSRYRGRGRPRELRDLPVSTVTHGHESPRTPADKAHGALTDLTRNPVPPLRGAMNGNVSEEDLVMEALRREFGAVDLDDEQWEQYRRTHAVTDWGPL